MLSTNLAELFSVDTYWNKNYKKSEEHSYPYRGYQDPNAIDWSVYGPDRPGKVTKSKNMDP